MDKNKDRVAGIVNVLYMYDGPRAILEALLETEKARAKDFRETGVYWDAAHNIENIKRTIKEWT